MEGFKIGVLAALSLVGILLLRQWKPEWAVFLRVAAVVLMAGVALTMVSQVITDLRTMGGQALPEETLTRLYKALGLSILTHIGASICRDAGESGLATWVETAGKLEILLLSLPLIRDVLADVSELIGMSG